MNLASIALLADMWDTNGHMGGGWWIVMMLWMLIFWAAVIAGIVWLVRGGASESWRTPRRETPRDVLDRRFAEGAISEDEYLDRREVIAHGGSRQRSEPHEPAPQ
jgi:putative membrane protein